MSATVAALWARVCRWWRRLRMSPVERWSDDQWQDWTNNGAARMRPYMTTDARRGPGAT